MGRYYSGDIDGKFMFGIQSSVAADRFGAEYMQPGYVDYHFDEDNLDVINQQLEQLKPGFDICNEFFEKMKKDKKVGYTLEDRDKAGVSESNMSDYADYRLGIKIKDCIEKNGTCSFSAEL